MTLLFRFDCKISEEHKELFKKDYSIQHGNMSTDYKVIITVGIGTFIVAIEPTEDKSSYANVALDVNGDDALSYDSQVYGWKEIQSGGL